MSGTFRWRLATRVALVSLLGALLCACANKSRPLDEIDTGVRPPLEVPPDLSQPTFDDSYAIPARGAVRASAVQQVPGGCVPVRALDDVEGVTVAGSGAMRWLTVGADADALWGHVLAFWRELGVALAWRDERALVMETEWIEDLAALAGEVSPSSTEPLIVWNKFRLRLEPMADRTATEVFVSHLAARKMSQRKRHGWQPLGSDSLLEAWLLRRLMVSLGASGVAADQAIAAAVDQGKMLELVAEADGTVLRLHERFVAAWRRVGVALDRARLPVDDRNRSNGLYFVTFRGQPEGGFWARLFGGAEGLRKNEQYQVQLQGQQEYTDIMALDARGERLDTASNQALLQRLRDALAKDASIAQ